MAHKPFLSKYGASLSEGIWSLIDQFSFAAGNFALNIYLARTMSHAEYGLFASNYTAFLLASSLYMAFFVEPMTIYGSRNFLGNINGYIDKIYTWHRPLALGAMAAGVLLGAGLWLLGAKAAPSIAATLLFSPIILWQWLVRQACYINKTPALAGLGGAIYIVSLALLLGALHALGLTTAASAFVSVAVCSGLSAWYIRRNWKSSPGSDSEGALSASWDFHRNYSKSSFAVALFYWFPTGLPILILPITGGIEAVALLRVLSNLSLPILQLLAALNRLFVPWFASAGHVMTPKRCCAIIGAISTVLALVLYFFGNAIIQTFYGASYTCSTTNSLLIGVAGICAGQAAVLSAYHKAGLRQHLPTRAYGLAAVVGCLVAYPLTHEYGVTGALATGTISIFVTLVGLLIFTWTNHGHPPTNE